MVSALCTGQPPFSRGICCCFSQASVTDPLRPACCSCRPMRAAPCLRQKAIDGLQRRLVLVAPQAEVAGASRPSRSTAVASMISRPAPEMLMFPRCIRCHSLAQPFYGRVLRHRRHHDAVGEVQTAQAERREQMRGHCCEMLRFRIATRRGLRVLRGWRRCRGRAPASPCAPPAACRAAASGSPAAATSPRRRSR